VVHGMALNAICRCDQDLSTVVVPLICYYIVEWHLSIRVVCQFGGLQAVAVQHKPMSYSLHKSYTIHLCVLCLDANLSTLSINVLFVSCAG
jgi:hypothetical protein